MRPRHPLPRLWMMTDERQGAALLPSIRRLPPGSGIIFRHYSLPPAERRALFERVKRLARSRRLRLFLAAGPARRWGAGGSHGHHEPGLPHSASAHDLREIRAAEAAGTDLLFVSPVFATRSHPGQPALGGLRFRLLARSARRPVIALGGMDRRRASNVRAYGWAAIDALTRGGHDRLDRHPPDLRPR